MNRIPNFWNSDFETNESNIDCCGCELCALVCPKKAIEYKVDEEGFLYPFVHDNNCINCGVCYKLCPSNNAKDNRGNSTITVYAGYSNDNTVLMTSASGGFAATLSRIIIRNNGVVFGVQYDDSFQNTVYSSANNEHDILKYSNSKYIQSRKNDVFVAVRKYLEQGKIVLFTGCPCDISALNLFLGKEYENLYECELICMGVTAPKVLHDYLLIEEKKEKQEIKRINMRGKKYGWFVSSLEIEYIDSKVKNIPLYSSYFGFAFENYIRPSCTSCKFRNKNSMADFRIGDYWGVKKTDSFWNSKGVSCIFVATTKGNNLLEKIKSSSNFYFKDIKENAAKIIKNNNSISKNKGKEYVNRRNRFAKVYKENGLIIACKKTATLSFKIKRIIPYRLQSAIKHLLHYFIDR